MQLVRLIIRGISYTENQGNVYTLILDEVAGNRKLPIVIGSFEAQSIAIGLNKSIFPPRPMTHDFFKNFIDRFGIYIKQVIIHKLIDGIFYSSVICEKDGIEEIIDARTSDAVALSVRFHAPIYIYESIIQKVGVNSLDDNFHIKPFIKDERQETSSDGNTHKKPSMPELEQMLEKAIEKENYELAAKIRDEIEKRRNT